MASLTVGAISTDSTTISTAEQLVASNSSSTYLVTTNTIKRASGWDELWSQGDTANWAALGAIGDPSGHGYVYETAALDGQRIASGTWTPDLYISRSSTTGVENVTFVMRLYRYRSGAYDLIFQSTSSEMTFTTSYIQVTGWTTNTDNGGTSTADFVSGDRLYLDIWANARPTSNPTTTETLRHQKSNTGSGSNHLYLVTPGYGPTPQTIAIAGQADGSANATTATLAFTRGMLGQADGVALATAEALVTKLMVGTASGVAGASADLAIVMTVDVAGTASGTAGGSADVTVLFTIELDGSAAGTAGASATLDLTRAIAGSAVGVGAASADVLCTVLLDGSAGGSAATTTATLALTHTIEGTAAGASAPTAEVTVTAVGQVDIAGTAPGTGEVSVALALIHTISGETQGSATVTGDLTIVGLVAIAGVANGGASDVSASLTFTYALWATSAGTGILTATILIIGGQVVAQVTVSHRAAAHVTISDQARERVLVGSE